MHEEYQGSDKQKAVEAEALKAEQRRAFEDVNNYQIWLTWFLAELKALGENLDKIDSKDSLFSLALGSGFDNICRVYTKVYGGRVGMMSMDFSKQMELITDGKIEIGHLYPDIPVELIDLINEYIKTEGGSPLPSKVQVEQAIVKISNLKHKVDGALATAKDKDIGQV